MSIAQENLGRDDFHVALDHLVAAGWIRSWGQKQGEYVVQWTPLGLERREWIRTIDRELVPDARGMLAVCAICVSLKG